MQYVPEYENKVNYIVDLINVIPPLFFIVLGVREGVSTKKFWKFVITIMEN